MVLSVVNSQYRTHKKKKLWGKKVKSGGYNNIDALKSVLKNVLSLLELIEIIDRTFFYIVEKGE